MKSIHKYLWMLNTIEIFEFLFYTGVWWFGGGLVTKSCLTLATTRAIAVKVPLSIGFSRQLCWSIVD